LGFDHRKGTGKAAANQIIESMIIILRARFFLGVTPKIGTSHINLIG